MHPRILFVLTASVAFPATLWTAFQTHAATARLEARHAVALEYPLPAECRIAASQGDVPAG